MTFQLITLLAEEPCVWPAELALGRLGSFWFLLLGRLTRGGLGMGAG